MVSVVVGPSGCNLALGGTFGSFAAAGSSTYRTIQRAPPSSTATKRTKARRPTQVRPTTADHPTDPNATDPTDPAHATGHNPLLYRLVVPDNGGWAT